MKRIAKRGLLLALGLLMIVVPVLLLQALSQVWEPDQTEAELQAALNSGKLVLVAFHSKNCTYCKADEPVLEEVAQGLEGVLIVVRVRVETAYGKELAQKVGVSGVPAYYLIDSVTGELLYEQVGPLNVGRMIQTLEEGRE